MKRYTCKRTAWFDMLNNKEMYGIKVLHNGKWIDAGDDTGLFLFSSMSEREEKIEELSKELLK
tara:strand:+ start:3221 stop:3409 length:189 start_codon:yes stop_codon:yes gene_type:complete